MSNRDRFESQGTGGLKPATGGLKDAPRRDALLLEELLGLKARAEKSISSYGPRIEALRRGCEAAGLPIPGGASPGPAPPPAAASVVAYLGRRLPLDAALDRAVRLAVGRYASARALAAEAEVALAEGQVAPGLVEGLKRELYFLSHLYESFRSDLVLAKLFPAPKLLSHPGPQGSAPPAPKAGLESPTVRVRGLLARLEKNLGAQKLTLAILDGQASLKSLFFDPQAKTARAAALALAQRPVEVEALRRVLNSTEALQARLAGFQPDADPEGLTSLAATLESQIRAARELPLLRLLFPGDPTPSARPVNPLGRHSGLALP